jgi:hypothetical protein
MEAFRDRSGRANAFLITGASENFTCKITRKAIIVDFKSIFNTTGFRLSPE